MYTNNKPNLSHLSVILKAAACVKYFIIHLINMMLIINIVAVG